MRRPALVLAVPLIAMSLSGCLTQLEEANDTPTPDDNIPSLPANVDRTPEPVETAPLTVPLPGPTNSP